MAFLVVLESMTPAERVAFILHDVFRLPLRGDRRASSAVPRPPAASWLPPAAAAAAPPTARRPPPPASPPSSATSGTPGRPSDIAALVALLDPDAVITADGGGQATAARHPIEGAGQVSRYLADIAAHTEDLTIIERTVNGPPGLIAQRGGTTVTVLAFGIEGTASRASGRSGTRTSSAPGPRADPPGARARAASRPGNRGPGRKSRNP